MRVEQVNMDGGILAWSPTLLPFPSRVLMYEPAIRFGRADGVPTLILNIILTDTYSTHH
jgi:hypothetical protein